MAVHGFRLWLVAALVAVLGGCAATGDWRHLTDKAADASITQCLAELHTISRALRKAGVTDAAARPVAGFPYLRADRFLASFRGALGTGPDLAAWVGRMRALDRAGRRIELANLPPPARQRLNREIGADALDAVAGCGDRLARRDLADATAVARLKHAVTAPDHYLGWRRVLGLYPLTSIGVSAGYRRWQRDTLGDFSTPLDDIPAEGDLIAYVPGAGAAPPDRAEIARILADSDDNPLAIPEPVGRDLDRLIEGFAPIWLIDTASPDDRIGAPKWKAAKRAVIDTTEAVTYFRLSHMRLEGDILLQLNYAIWFPGRPKGGPLDLLGGRFDGIIWRVTLDRDGRVLLYDSIHQCGCYQLFFPSPGMEIRPEADGANGEDGVVAPQPAPALGPGQHVVVRIAPASHYIVRLGARAVDSVGGTAIPYALAPNQGLRSLAVRNGRRRSLFGPNGLVAGSNRSERFLLWPMGILSAGAMRQWGTHATAFVGHRHFDDPDLLAKSFLFRRRGRQ